jgi:hypothetical protein
MTGAFFLSSNAGGFLGFVPVFLCVAVVSVMHRSGHSSI